MPMEGLWSHTFHDCSISQVGFGRQQVAQLTGLEPAYKKSVGTKTVDAN